MRGKIAAISQDGRYGQIAGEDGQQLSYWVSEVRNGPANVGQAVEYTMWEGQPVEIYVSNNPRPPTGLPPRPPQQPQMNYAPATAPQPQYGGMPAAYPQAASQSLPAGYWVQLFTSPSGRISRRQFWLHGFLPLIIAECVLGLIPLLNIVLMFLATWAWICLAFKRFHDRSLSGWWSLAGIVPSTLAIIIAVASLWNGGSSWGLVSTLYGVGLLIGLAQLFLVYVRVGVQGENRFGPDPLAVA